MMTPNPRMNTAKATIGGKLAQVGSRLVDGVAKKLAENFFSAFNKHVSGVKGERPHPRLLPQ